MIWQQVKRIIIGDKKAHEKTIAMLEKQKESAEKLAQSARSGAAVIDEIVRKEARHA